MRIAKIFSNGLLQILRYVRLGQDGPKGRNNLMIKKFIRNSINILRNNIEVVRLGRIVLSGWQKEKGIKTHD